jgi:biopolymer transport protein ExbB
MPRLLRVYLLTAAAIVTLSATVWAETSAGRVGGSVKDVVEKGGVCMVFILIGSIAGMAIVFERLVQLRKSTLLPAATMKAVRDALAAGQKDSILAIVSGGKSSIERIIHSGLKRVSYGPQEMERFMEIIGSREVTRLKRPVKPLAVLASVEPLLGLMGTVFGMIKTFKVLNTSTAAERVSKLAPGIAEALYTTAGGLVAAVPFLIFYHYLNGRVNRAAEEWSIIGTELVEAWTPTGATSVKAV